MPAPLRAHSIAEFIAKPFGRYCAGRQSFTWCRDAGFNASLQFGEMDERELTQLVGAFEFATHPDMQPYHSYSDMADVVVKDPMPFLIVNDYMQKRKPLHERLILKQAVLLPRDLFSRSLVKGYFESVSPAIRCFDDAIEALTFLGETDEVLEVMERIRNGMGASHALLPALRDVLRERYASIDLAGAAEHLGVSTRSLQRVLTAAQTGFAAELRRARLAVAEHLLCTTSLKISAIARSVAYASDAHFCRAFKAAHAVEPSVWRAAKLAG